MGRHLISLIDGTRVSASQTKSYSSYSNVYELAYLLQLRGKSDDGRPQVVFYTSGISSQPDTKDAIDLLTGNTIRSQIVDQYTSICANFDFRSQIQSDKIYIFGFSRGAMAARALAALISIYGLLHPTDIRAVPEVMSAWEKGRPVPDGITLQPVEIEFVGLFDAVMGGIEWLPMFNPIRFPHQKLSQNVRHAVHVLSIDDNRYLFRPKLWSEKVLHRRGVFKQVWLPGSHSDVGGTGNTVWGRSAMLTMAYYVEKYTDLYLDDGWIKRKERNLRDSIKGEMIFIDRSIVSIPHKRRPFGTNDAKEIYHPIIEHFNIVEYNGKKKFPWKDRIFEDRFASLETDPGLRSYFKKILR